MKAVAAQQQEKTGSLRGRLILLGAFLYLLFLLVQMPLAWLLARLPDTLPVQFGRASGTLWQGAVNDLVWRVNADHIRLGNLSWQWLPAELLHGRVGLDFVLNQAPHRLGGSLSLGRNNLRLRNVQGQIDAALLGFASPPFGLLQPQGSLKLDVTDLVISLKRMHGDARVDWQAARSGMVTVTLGDYRALLRSEPDGRRALFDVQTVNGPLTITGNGEYLPGKALLGNLRLMPPPGDAGAPFRPALSLLGRPNAEGAWLLNFNLR